MKNWKRKLKNFPDKSSRKDNGIKIVKEEITNIKNDIDNVSSEDFVDDGFKVFSKLLIFLKDSKDIKLLQICRQIKSLEIKDSSVKLIAEDFILDEISQSNDVYSKLKDFFLSLNLSFSLIKKEESNSKVDVLKYWLGEKLIIK